MGTVHPLDDAFEHRAKRKRGREPGGDEYDGTNYDPRHFYIRSTDGRGHGDKLSITVPPELLGRIGAIVEGRHWPYRTSHDLIRDAVMHRLHALNEITPDDTMAEFLNQQRLLYLLEQQEMLLDNARKTVDTAKDHIWKAVHGRDWQLAVNAIIAADRTVDGMREPYRTDLKGIVQRAIEQVPRGWLHELREAGVLAEKDH